MTHELKLKVGSPHVLRDHIAEAVVGYSQGSNIRHTLEDLLAQIEEQVKPAIEEPREFGSIVRAISGVVSVNGTLWQMAPGHGEHYWEDEHGCVEVWSGLTDVEVLRVGLGEPNAKPLTASALSRMSIEAHQAKLNGEAEAFREGEAFGQKVMNGKIHAALRNILAESITSERKNALEKAIQAVEELAL